jgi:hypothetical protein
MSEAAADQRESPPLAETPDIYGAYPRLSDDQIATLEAGGARLDRLAEHPRRRKRTSHAAHNPQISPNMSARLTDGTTSPRRRCLRRSITVGAHRWLLLAGMTSGVGFTDGYPTSVAFRGAGE